MQHQITKNGLIIPINFDRGSGQRYFDHQIATNTYKRIFHIGENIDHNTERFEIVGQYILIDENGNTLNHSQSRMIYIPVVDESFDQLYNLALNGGGEEIAKRAINGMFEYEFQAKDFFPFDPLNNMANIQPVEFTLSSNGDDINIIHTDGSGTYQYSLDGGQNWGDASVLVGVGVGDYNVSVKDDTSNWFRTKSVTVQGA